VTLKVRAADAHRKLILRDACTGKWGKSARGRSWDLSPVQNPDEFGDAEADFTAGGRKLGTRHFSVGAFFRGRRIAYIAFDVKTALARPSVLRRTG
jgi:hypothetical protein